MGKLDYSIGEDGETCTIVGVGNIHVSDIVIPEEIDGYRVTAIHKDAFSWCQWMTSISIPDSVTSIEAGTFRSCINLTHVDVGNGVTRIGNSAFDGCYYLASVTLGTNVTEIGISAFDECYRLTEVKNLSSLDIVAGKIDPGFVGKYAKRVYKDGESYLSTTDDGFILYNDGTKIALIGYVGNKDDIVIPDNVTEINSYAFYENRNIRTVKIPTSVKTIDTNAFINVSSLVSIAYDGTKAEWNLISKAPQWKGGGVQYIDCSDEKVFSP